MSATPTNSDLGRPLRTIEIVPEDDPVPAEVPEELPQRRPVLVELDPAARGDRPALARRRGHVERERAGVLARPFEPRRPAL